MLRLRVVLAALLLAYASGCSPGPEEIRVTVPPPLSFVGPTAAPVTAPAPPAAPAEPVLIGETVAIPGGTATIYTVKQWEVPAALAGAPQTFRPGIAADVEVHSVSAAILTDLSDWTAQDGAGRVWRVNLFGGERPAFPSPEPLSPGGTARGWVLFDVSGVSPESLLYRYAVPGGFKTWTSGA